MNSISKIFWASRKGAPIMLLLVLALSLSQCANRKNASSNSTDNSEEMVLEDNNELLDDEGWDESLGFQVLSGTLTTTKGAQAMLKGVLLSSDIFSEDHKEAMSIIQGLKGRQIQVEGEVIRHHCGAMEQCLDQGYIDVLRKAKSIKYPK